MLEQIVKYAQKEYSWDASFAGKVVYEYKRFIYLKSLDSNCYPSDSVNNFWKLHILFTENYSRFCIENFGKFVHHIPDMSLDRKERISRTIKLYMKTFPSVTYPDVWDINLELANLDITKKTSSSQTVKLRVVYVYRDNKYGKYLPNKKRSCSLTFADKILDINITPGMTYGDITNFISSKTSHMESSIKIYLSNDMLTCKYKSESGSESYLNKNYKIDLNISKYYVAELEELNF